MNEFRDLLIDSGSSHAIRGLDSRQRDTAVGPKAKSVDDYPLQEIVRQQHSVK
jgi:hypothetical protein